MQLLIESTDQLTEIDGVPVRVWKGTTEDGVSCDVFVHRIAVLRDADNSVFEANLAEQPVPGQIVDLRQRI